MREKMARRLRQLAATVGLALALIVFFISSVFAQQSVVEPIDGDTCGSIVANVYPPFDKSQTIVQPSTGARFVGALLAKGNDMTITTSSGEQLTKEVSDFGRLWTMPISGTQVVTLTTSSGPDQRWITFAAAAGFRRLAISMGDPTQDDAYDRVIFKYTATASKIKGCVIGAYDAADNLPVSMIVRVGEQKREVEHKKIDGSKIAGTLDLITFEADAQPGQEVEIEITNLETTSMLRARYFIGGLAISGAIQSGQVVDDDGDGIPNDEDPNPQIKGCIITGAAGEGPYEVLKVLTVDITLSGEDCWGNVFLRHPIGQLVGAELSDGSTVLKPDSEEICFSFTSLPMSGCELGKYTQFRLHIKPTRAGEQYGWINLGFVDPSVRFWSYEWDIKGANLFAPWVAR